MTKRRYQESWKYHDLTWEEACEKMLRARIKYSSSDRTENCATTLLFRRSTTDSLLAAVNRASEMLIDNIDVAEVRELERIKAEINDAKAFVVSCALWQCENYEIEETEAYKPYREHWLRVISDRAKYVAGTEIESIDDIWWRRRYYLATALLTVMGVPAEVADEIFAKRIEVYEQRK